MRPPREPLIPPALGFAAGIAVFSHIPFSAAELTVGAVPAALCAAAAYRWARRVMWLPAAVLLALCGGFAIALNPAPPPLELDAADGELLVVAGCVDGVPEVDGPRVRFPIALEPRARVLAALTAREGESLPALRYGQRVELEVKVRKPRNFGNPGAFDYVRYLHRQQTFWIAGARGVEKLRVVGGGCGSEFAARVFEVRGWFAERLRRLYTGDPKSGRLMPALLLGDGSGLERSWTEDFRRTGTYHAIVISGLHITVVAGLALFLLRVAGAPLWATLVISAALAWAYAAVADWQAPVVRSAAGFTLFLAGRWFFRRGRLLNLLAATAVLFLAADPGQLFEPSFQLTFLSVAAIGAISSPLIERWPAPYAAALRALSDPARDLPHPPPAAQFRIELRLLAETAAVWTRLPARAFIAAAAVALRIWFWVVEMALVSVAVQLCLGLVLVLYFHQLSATSAAANLFVVPLLTAAVPLALATAVTEWAWLAAVTGALVRAATWMAAWWAAHEPAWRIPDPPLAALLAGSGAVAVLAVLTYRRARGAWVVAGFLGATGFFMVLAVAPFPVAVASGRLELTAIDVGQGDGMLVAFPDGQLMLVDGGGIPAFDPRIKPRLEIGEDVVSPYLWTRGIRRLDIVVATHLHDDHAAGLPAVIRNFQPREVWIGARIDCPLLGGIDEAARSVGAVVHVRRYPFTHRFGEAEAAVLSPPPDYAPESAPSNDDSMLLAIRFREHRFLLTGDMGFRVEERLLAAGLPGEVDVLKVAHHGGRGSTGAAFLDSARPLFAVVSAGAGNSYGHPHPDVVRRLRSAGARLLRTDVDGCITVRTDGRRISIESGRDRPGGLPFFSEKASQ